MRLHPSTVLRAEHTWTMQPRAPKLIPKCAPVSFLLLQPGFHVCQWSQRAKKWGYVLLAVIGGGLGSSLRFWCSVPYTESPGQEQESFMVGRWQACSRRRSPPHEALGTQSTCLIIWIRWFSHQRQGLQQFEICSSVLWLCLGSFSRRYKKEVEEGLTYSPGPAQQVSTDWRGGFFYRSKNLGFSKTEIPADVETPVPNLCFSSLDKWKHQLQSPENTRLWQERLQTCWRTGLGPRV